MSVTTLDVLLVEDSLALAQVYLEYLRNEPLTVSHVEDGESALRVIRESMPQVVVLDLELPDMHGIDVLKEIRSQDYPVEVIIATGTGTVNHAVETMRYGAIDFLEKPFSADRLITTVNNTIERHRLNQLVENIDTLRRTEFCGFVGSSLPMQLVYQTIEQVSPSTAPIFISGESGTGKEVCANAIHQCSDRAEGPLIALNCAAIPKDLIESEIFGHKKGAFTGAVEDRDGAATMANGGTLFLDEIAEMDIDLQAKLLRFIQTMSFQRLGDSKIQEVDIRFVCATNKNALQEVEAGNFREDLYYRLNVINIDLPPLRSRDQDVLEIADAFLEQFAAADKKEFTGFDGEAAQAMLSHNWPGNIRELQNMVRRAVVMQAGGEITKDMLPELLAQKPSSKNIETPTKTEAVTNQTLMSDIKPLWMIEKEAIEHAIKICNGGIPKAAALLDVSPSTIYRKIQAWEAKTT